MKGRNSCWLAPAAFVLDRLTKLLAQKALAPGVRTDALPGLFRFVLVKNTGAAFSMLSGRQGLLIGVTALALIAMIVFQLTRGRKQTPLFRAGLWLLIGGAGSALGMASLMRPAFAQLEKAGRKEEEPEEETDTEDSTQ